MSSAALGVGELVGNFKLEVATSGENRVIFERRHGHLSHLVLTNKSGNRQTYKVKSSSNDMLLMQPVMGTLEAGQTADVALRFRRPADKPSGWTPADDLHHYSISHIPAPEGATARGVWHVHGGPPTGLRRIRCRFN